MKIQERPNDVLVLEPRGRASDLYGNEGLAENTNQACVIFVSQAAETLRRPKAYLRQLWCPLRLRCKANSRAAFARIT